MGLRHEREMIVSEALDQVHLPQRPLLVQGTSHETSDEFVELFPRSGPRERRAANVVREIKVGVIDPNRASDSEGNLPNPLAVAWNERDSLRDDFDKPVVVEALVRRAENRHASDVHGRRGVVQVQQRRVERAHPLVHPGISLATEILPGSP